MAISSRKFRKKTQRQLPIPLNKFLLMHMKVSYSVALSIPTEPAVSLSEKSSRRFPAITTRLGGLTYPLALPNPRKSGSVIGADRQRFGPSCVLLNAYHKAERRVGV
jgi:hypothetical protein